MTGQINCQAYRYQINVSLVKERLYANEKTREKILRHYAINSKPSNACEFCTAVVGALDQRASPQPLRQNLDKVQVFRAAVRAIGSNNRMWSTFLRSERRLSELLAGFDPTAANRLFQGSGSLIHEIKACLPGQSSSADARAICNWAQLLSQIEDYYHQVCEIGQAFIELHSREPEPALNDPELLLCLVGYLVHPPTSWPGDGLFARAPNRIHGERLRLPGMGYVLASEFMRNLGWDGFKPDRHIQRLLDRWFPNPCFDRDKVDKLQRLIGRSPADLRTYLRYSLTGIAVSPGNMHSRQPDMVARRVC